MKNYDELQKLAEAATPGPWAYFPKPKYNEHHVSLPIDGSGMRRALFDTGCETDRPEQDARFIAAANPAAIKELLSELTTLRAIAEASMCSDCKGARIVLEGGEPGGCDTCGATGKSGACGACGACVVSETRAAASAPKAELTDEQVAAAAYSQFGIVADDQELVAFARWVLAQAAPVAAQKPVAWLHELPAGEFFDDENGQNKQICWSEAEAEQVLVAHGGTLTALTAPAPATPLDAIDTRTEQIRIAFADYTGLSRNQLVRDVACLLAHNALLRSARPASPAACPDCHGSGERDSGGILPWGEAAMVPCGCAAPAAPVAAAVPAGWVSVAERLPENGAQVLIYTPNARTFKVWIDERYDGGWNDWNDSEVSHWAPMPAAPAQETGDAS